jgi:ATP-dependent protease La
MSNERQVLLNLSNKTDMNKEETTSDDLVFPVLALPHTVLFPHIQQPLFIDQARALAAVEAATARDNILIVATQRETDAPPTSIDVLYTIAVEARIQRTLKMPDGSTNVFVQGLRRVRLGEQVANDHFLCAKAAPIYVDEERTLVIEAMMRAVLSLFEKVVKLSRSIPDDAYILAMNIDEPGWLADQIASVLPLDVARRQTILETLDPEERLRRINVMLMQELDLLELEGRIQSQAQQELDRNQRQNFLREQMRIIQLELGQEDPYTLDLHDLHVKLETNGLPERAFLKAQQELERLESLPTATPEYSILRTYLEWLLDLPWSNESQDINDLRLAAEILDEYHYGLPKIKDRILEFMAVRQLAGPKHKSPILCFVGPPGVGKTSLGRSIAEALGRQFVRVSLGGVHDEAEIRGHRRTYVGALPGRILQTMKEAGTINPVFMLDEIDKLDQGYRGDPGAALLEVLDPEQNHSFSDHYLETPYDLSKVLFIVTANMLDTIPEALLDRLEVIELSSYIEEEKLEIASQFLVPKQWEANGLPKNSLTFSYDALLKLIRDYTDEAGVRNLEREIGAICRKTARRLVEGRPFQRRVTPSLIERYLGPPRYSHNIAEERDEVGVATGLAYTPSGGEVMPVEVSLMEGKGNLTLTGQMGEVMQESAQAALSYVRSNAKKLDIDAKRFDRVDIHVHVPEGGVPKDGPSAGITICTSMISAFSNRAVRRSIAMTGEITLRGRILPVGGIREKLLGAYRAGISTIIIPHKNLRDLHDLPSKVKRKLSIIGVQHMDEVIDHVLLEAPPKQKKTRSKKRVQDSKTAKNDQDNPDAKPDTVELNPAATGEATQEGL